MTSKKTKFRSPLSKLFGLQEQKKRLNKEPQFQYFMLYSTKMDIAQEQMWYNIETSMW